jgi:hypothetical protein
MVIYKIDRRTPLEVGRIIRIKESRGSQWATVKVTRVDASGHFFADRL